MADTKTSRLSLKAFFQAGDIPEEQHFEALIDSGINQINDKIQKSATTSLQIAAASLNVPGTGQDVIQLYESFGENGPINDPNWRISLQDSSGDQTKKGLLISKDYNIKSLFISQDLGYVGIASANPKTELEVGGTVTAKSFIISSSSGNGITFRDNLSSDDDDATQIHLSSSTTTTLEITSAGHITLKPNKNVGIGVDDPTAKLDVAGHLKLVGKLHIFETPAKTSEIDLSNDFGLGRDKNGFYFKAKHQYSWKDGSGGQERMILTTVANGGLTITGTGQSAIAGKLSIGTLTTQSGFHLDVKGKAKASSFSGLILPTAGSSSTSGIQFPADPGGGYGDAAWIRYYARAGESTVLELGVSNDYNDHIALMPSGNVGIGNITPTAKLEVAGNVKATTFFGQVRPTAGKTANDGILFPLNPGGGSGDAAWIRYYPITGESTVLEIGTSDNYNDHIALMPSGNVGIGIKNPLHQLHVNGTARATKFRIGNTEIGEAELQVLKKLAASQLTVKIMSKNGYVLDNYADRVNNGDRDRTIQFQRDVGYQQTKMKLVIW